MSDIDGALNVLRLLKTDPGLERYQIADRFGWTTTRTLRVLRELSSQHLIRRVRGGIFLGGNHIHYYVLDDPDEL